MNEESKIKYQKPRGTRDLIGKDLLYFDEVSRVCNKVAKEYNFQRIRTPLFEELDLFVRGVGDGTDVVDKEMYTLEQGKRKLALKPEGTAPVVRAYIENGMQSWSKPVRLYYLEPYFRHEKPQAGRFRQFWQFGTEVFGKNTPVIDVHVIQMYYSLLKELGIKDLKIKVNSVGCDRCADRYKKELKSYLTKHKKELCADCQNRIKKNILRTLDCKKKKCQGVISEAPQVLDSLWKKCRIHLKSVLEYMDELKLPYELDSYLVRGLDYYTRTVFEIVTPDSENSLVGGGRYDNLIETLGGVPTPAFGAAMGIDRVAELLRKKRLWLPQKDGPKVFLAQLGITSKKEALSLFEELRTSGIWVAQDLSGNSLSRQLSRANKLGVDYVVILAQKELIDGEVIIRDMNNDSQSKVKLKDLKKELKKRIK